MIGQRTSVLHLLAAWASAFPAKAAEPPAIRIVPADEMVSVGETFAVDLLLRNPEGLAIGGFQCFLEFDCAVLEALGAEATAVGAFPPGDSGVGFVALGPWPGSGFARYPLWSDGSGVEAVAALGFALPGVSTPVTDAQAVLARFRFRALAPASAFGFRTTDLLYPVTTTLVGADGRSLETRLESQALRIVSIARPADLGCAADGSAAVLTWSESQPYDDVVVKRDGQVVGQIEGGIGSFRDPGTAVGGRYAYEVVGMVGLQRSPSARCDLSIPLPCPGEISCVAMGDRIRVSWVPRDAYDAVTIARDGEVIAVASGESTSIIDAPPPAWDPARIEYVLVARRGEWTSQPAFCRTTFASPRFVRGDTDGNGSLNIGDAIRLLDHLFTKPTLACEDAGDVDDDGSLNLGDAIAILNFLFAGGRSPAPPFPEPGIDLSADTLTCAPGL